MGDSEITAARNYAEGAGGFFKGIDALPLTGQYTHYSLDKKNRQAELCDRLRRFRYRMDHRRKKL
ncbi:alkaline phosphatase [Klebsiella oxytoca]|nr:alkaline phosphatase [Klebsiella oxytoca]